MPNNNEDQSTISLPLKYIPAILQLLAMVGVGIGATHLGGDGSHLDCARRLDAVESSVKQNREHIDAHGTEIKEIRRDDLQTARDVNEVKATQRYILQELQRK